MNDWGFQMQKTKYDKTNDEYGVIDSKKKPGLLGWRMMCLNSNNVKRRGATSRRLGDARAAALLFFGHVISSISSLVSRCAWSLCLVPRRGLTLIRHLCWNAVLVFAISLFLYT